MSALDTAHRYFDAWNARDADAILGSLSVDATYRDPMTNGPVKGDAIKRYASGLWESFPDLSFDIVSVAETGGGRIAAEWLMRGTNLGPFRGLPPTGKRIETAGADFLTTAGGKVTSVSGYFDAGSVPRQLGLQLIVQPSEIGPFRFGVSTAVQTGNPEAPAAFSITQLQALDDEAALQVRERSRGIMLEMMKTSGFIGAVAVTIGQRQMTVSAWSDAQAPARFAREGSHAAAMQPFFAGSIAEAGYTSVWSPTRINAYWVRCSACRRMTDARTGGQQCSCGTRLSAPPPYW